jgi:transposase
MPRRTRRDPTEGLMKAKCRYLREKSLCTVSAESVERCRKEGIGEEDYCQSVYLDTTPEEELR